MQKTLSQPINKTHFILLQHIQLQEKKQPNIQNHPKKKKKNLKPKFNIYNLIPLRRHKHIIQNHPTSSKRPGLALGEHLGHCLGSPIKNRPQIFKINN